MYKESAVNKGMFMHYEQNIKLQVQKYFFIQSVVANLDHVLHRRLTRNKIFLSFNRNQYFIGNELS